MGDFATTIENIVINHILANGRIMPQASRANQTLLIFAGGCFLAGILLLVYALYLWILVTLGQIPALVCTAVVLMMIAAGSVYGMTVYRDRKIASVHKDMSEAIQSAVQLIKEDVGDVVQSNPKLVITAACLAGLVIGKKML